MNDAPCAYFAYGSNLSRRQMRDRCPTALVVSAATLEHHRLVFPRYSVSWEGGVAGIEPKPGMNVHGAVYLLQQGDLDALDEYEGIDDGNYMRAKVKVILPNGSSLEADTYFACRESHAELSPSPRYLKSILEGAHDHQLPTEWINWLQKRLEMCASEQTP